MIKKNLNRVLQSLHLILNQLTPNTVKSYLAKSYWRNKYNTCNDGYASIIYKHSETLNLSLNQICEFGSHKGRNLKYFLDNNQNISATGIDINPVVKDLEENYKNYMGIIGDEKTLSKFDNNFFDLSFTFSVLDHIPSKKIVFQVLKDLIRTSKVVILLEPYIENVEGDVSNKARYMVKDGLVNEYKSFNSFCYLWNYDKYLIDNNLTFTKKNLPLHKASLGPFYNLYIITKKNSHNFSIYDEAKT
jgi:hypothetical protein